jgi:predicted nucleic acid-binding protein
VQHKRSDKPERLGGAGQLMASPSVAYREEPAGLLPIWQRLGAMTRMSTKLWTDAYLAVFASAGGLEMVTLDQRFSQFAGVRVTILDPQSPPQNS